MFTKYFPSYRAVVNYLIISAMILSTHPAYGHSDHSHTVDILVTSIERTEDASTLKLSVNFTNHYDETMTLTTLVADIAEKVTVYKHTPEKATPLALPLNAIIIPPNSRFELEAPNYHIELSDIAESSQQARFINLYFNFGTEDVYSVSKYIP